MDAYLLEQIIHDCDDPRATAILAMCRGALPPEDVLLVLARVLCHTIRDHALMTTAHPTDCSCEETLSQGAVTSTFS